VSTVVKSLKSIDNPPFKYGHISAFPNTPKSGCNYKNNRRKKYEHLWRISLSNREPITMEFDSINLPKTKKETTEQAYWHIYT
jgi:hypothetical protein